MLTAIFTRQLFIKTLVFLCVNSHLIIFRLIAICESLFSLFFFTSVCLKCNIPEGRRSDLKVFDQSDAEVDEEIFEEIVKKS